MRHKIKILSVEPEFIQLEKPDGGILKECSYKFGMHSCQKNGTYAGMLKAGLQFDAISGLIVPGQEMMVYISVAPDGRTLVVPDWNTYKMAKVTKKKDWQKENEHQENKGSLKCLDAAKLSLIGMYNAGCGGRVTFGVGNDGAVLGIDDEIHQRGGMDAVENYLRTNFKQATSGYLVHALLNICFETVENRTICHMSLPPSEEIEPVLYKEILPVRVGNQTQKYHGRDAILWTINRTRKFNPKNF